MSDIPPAAMNVVLPEQVPLPLDVTEDILSRLPVKTLKRFRAVQKSWCSLIDSENFAKAHLRRSLDARRSNRNLINGLNGFCWMSLAALEKVESFEPAFKYDEKDEHAISNSVNGMVVVMREPAPPVLWNPFTREHKVLPACPRYYQTLEEPHICRTTYGFGYDPVNDDYKVVKELQYRFKRPSPLSTSEYSIYGLRSNSWNRTRTLHINRHWPAHVDGVLYTIDQMWPDPHPSEAKLYGFSLVHEKEFKVRMPEEIEREGFVTVDAIEGQLSLGCAYESRFVIWIMKFPEWWIPLVQLKINPDVFVRPLAFAENWNKLLLNLSCKRLIGCELMSMNAKDIGVTFEIAVPFNSDWPFKVPDTYEIDVDFEFSPEIAVPFEINVPFEISPLFCLETLVSPHTWDKGKTGQKNLIGKSKKKMKKMKKKKRKSKKKMKKMKKKKRNKKWTWY